MFEGIPEPPCLLLRTPNFGFILSSSHPLLTDSACPEADPLQKDTFFPGCPIFNRFPVDSFAVERYI